jgi:hypothetical protein
MAFTVPNTAANAGKTASIVSKVTIARDRFDILLPLGNRKSGSVSLSLIDNRLAAAERTCHGMRTKPENWAFVCSKALEAKMED